MASPLPSPARRPASFLLVFALAYVGGVIAYLPLLSLLVPMKVGAIAGAARLDVLTTGVVAGALAASASNIVFGVLSDRSLARGGGRRRWLAGGATATGVAYAIVAWAASPVTVIVSVVVFQFAVNALLAPLMAIMADEVPDAQKGVAGGLLSLGAPAASMTAAVLIGTGSIGETARLMIVPCLTTILLLPLLLSGSIAAPRVDIAAAMPAAPRDLAFTWAARLLVQVAGNVVSLYLLYYFESILPNADTAVLASRISRLLTMAYLLPLPVALLAGRVSDRTGAGRPVLFAAATMAALGLLGLAVADGWAVGAVAFVLFATGSSVFLALHAAFAMQMLPDPEHRGRDLGLLNLTNTLPALAGPLLTWSLATPHDFAPAMIALAVLTFAGGIAMLGVRGGR